MTSKPEYFVEGISIMRLRTRSCAYNGFTVVELLVSVGVISILMALLLPAVQSVRESSRQIQCKNNLHQIGIAVHSFHDQYTYIDASRTLETIVAQMGEAPMAAAFKASDEAVLNGTRNDLSAIQSPRSYVCPSDSLARRNEKHVSYALNCGSTLGQSSGVRKRRAPYQFRFSEATDGLSSTSLFAEKLVPLPDLELLREADGRKSPLRYDWRTEVEFRRGEERAVFQHCTSPEVRAIATRGTHYFYTLRYGDPPYYDHILPPNNWSFTSLGDHGVGPFASSSQHVGGVQILFLDGSVDFVSSDVDVEVFWKLGTIAGGEPAAR